MILYKYHGAGNDFLIGDDRKGEFRLSKEDIARLCNRRTGLGADGLMLLEKSEVADFRMLYYNSDGSGGMMCGNGGRCMVAFAADMGYESFYFEAPDGLHDAVLLAGTGLQLENNSVISAGREKDKVVRLKMKDVPSYGAKGLEEYFLDTGTRHLVKFVRGLETYDVVGEGRVLRNDARFAPVGTNVNFIEILADTPCAADGAFQIRTFEKGVEDETLACGTGIVASALSVHAHLGDASKENKDVSYEVGARISHLQVDFTSRCINGVYSAENVWLTGPATYVARIEVDL